VIAATLVRAESPAHFFERCGPFLRETEAEHNLILGLATALLTGDHDYDPPIYLGWAEREEEVLGVVFRTPPFKLGVGALPVEVIPDLVADLAATYSAIPAVMGPPETARAVATMWAERKGAGVRTGARLRIHALSEVRGGLPTVPGHLRLADLDEQPLVRDWLRAFEDETGIPGLDPDSAAARMIAARQLYIWDDGGPACMTAALGATPTAMRVGYVYTPPGRRGSGYATSAVATLTALVLATGRRSLFLYTDLANPVSNRIYARIGYQPVLDVSDFEILAR
jgi:GNAT superfamily N-acetyltransferase